MIDFLKRQQFILATFFQAEVKGLLSSQLENVNDSEIAPHNNSSDEEEIQVVASQNRIERIEQATLKHLKELGATQTKEL